MKKIFSSLVLTFSMLAPMTASAYVLGPTTPGKWGASGMGTGATVTWSLMNTGVDCSDDGGGTCSSLADFMPVGFLSQIQAAFNVWSTVANITFSQIADDGAAFNAPTASGDIRIGGHAIDGAFDTLAHGYYPPVNGGSAAGDIHFDTAENWKTSFGGAGFSIFQVMAHEIGHAIGLDHTDVANSLMNPFYTEAFSGVQADDIAGAQFIYGVPVNNTVPEPTTLALVGLALVGISLRRRAVVKP